MTTASPVSPKPLLSQLSAANPTLWRQYVNKENQYKINTHKPTDSLSLGWSQPGSPTSPNERIHKRALQRSWASMVSSSILPGGSNENWNDSNNTHTSPQRKLSVTQASYGTDKPINYKAPYTQQPDYYAYQQIKAQPRTDVTSYVSAYTAAQGTNPYSKNAAKQFSAAAGL